MKSLSVLLAVVLFVFVSFAGPEQVDEQVDDIRKKTEALEYFLQDRKDYEKYCPALVWEQPSFEMYKAEPRSYLPKECKFFKVENL